MRLTMGKPITFVYKRTGAITIWQRVERFRVTGHSVPANPRTPDQVAARGYLGRAKEAWNTLAPQEKAVWSGFAGREFSLATRDFHKRWRGIDAFCRASVARQVAGLSALPALPEEPRPERVKSARLLPGGDGRQLAFTLTHSMRAGGGLALFVRVTPTTVSPGRSPTKLGLRYARGIGAQSVLPLPKSGAEVRMDGCRFDLVPGMPYALELRIVRLEDGAVSDSYYQIGLREQVAIDDVMGAKGEAKAEVAFQAETDPEAEDQEGFKHFPLWGYVDYYRRL